MSLLNPGFESGNLTGWQVQNSGNWPLANVTVTTATGYVDTGTYAVKITGTGAGMASAAVVNGYVPLIKPNSRVSLTARVRSEHGVKGNAFSVIALRFINADGTSSMVRSRQLATNEMRNGYTTTSISTTAPEGAVAVESLLIADVDGTNRIVYYDTVELNVEAIDDSAVLLVFPANGSVYQPDTSIPLRLRTADGLPVTSVKYVITDTTTAVEQEFVVSAAPWAYDIPSLPTGQYTARAIVSLGTSTLNTTTNSFSVGAAPTPPTREYLASNSYTYLVNRNISGLSAAVPPTAVVTGLETIIDFKLHMLVRAKDKGIEDPTSARYNVAFDIAKGVEFTTAMFSEDSGIYTQIGSPASSEHPLVLSDFSVVEDGITGNHRWTVLEGDLESVVVGSESSVFGLDNIAAANLPDLAVGVKATPVLSPKPDYADSGDASVRVALDKLRVRIYFDAGSVEYYFASPDKSMIIKGTLTSAEVLNGNFTSADASGVLQLKSDLEVVDGAQQWIGNDWTIHAAYPPSNANMIGKVSPIEGQAQVGMQYNGLPTQQQVRDNRSRYQFITANFYGDKDLNSIYGANGHGRGFAYNGDWFYKIYTQPSAEKDKPRHVAYHHWHLALGYNEGRVDISVVGEPYNFDGALGASSWTIGDQVVGLLPLSGTILGVFGAKSVWGISGTTVDNFATQTISPNIGATEYTITDMGMPVYANAYGVYTLSQTQEYGDYLGTPMSQDISPWLRPRLVRKYTTDREVEVAWPVRSKNQYRLAFSDGYVVSMTLNGQSVPTFSKQKYFLPPTGEIEVTNIYNQKSIVPAAVSSQLDVTGEERIHIAPYVEIVVPPPPPPPPPNPILLSVGFSSTLWSSEDGGLSFSDGYSYDGHHTSTFYKVGTRIYGVRQNGGPIYYSDDAVTWNHVPIGFSWTGLGPILHTGTKYLLFYTLSGQRRLATSVDGTSFTVAGNTTLVGAAEAVQLGNTIIVSNGSQIIRSTDAGDTWEAPYNIFARNLLVTDTHFVAFDSLGNAHRSTTGASGSWASTVITGATYAYQAQYNPKSGRIVIIDNKAKGFYSDDNGATWSEGSSFPYSVGTSIFNSYRPGYMIATGEAFLAIAPDYQSSAPDSAGDYHYVFRSPDGIEPWAEVARVDSFNSYFTSLVEVPAL